MKQQLQQQKEEREKNAQIHYTFTPTITKRKPKKGEKAADKNQKRNVSQFFQDQVNFKESVDMKNFQKQMQLAQNELDYMKNFAAKASKNSHKIYEKLRESQRETTPDVHDRLYQNQ